MSTIDISPEDLWDVLLRFHREVAMPDYQHIFCEQLGVELDRFAAGMRDGFAKIHERFDRIDGHSRESNL